MGVRSNAFPIRLVVPVPPEPMCHLAGSFERDAVLAALATCDWSIERAADALL